MNPLLTATLTALPPRASIVGDVLRAQSYFAAHPEVFSDKHNLTCGWTRSTYMLGHMALHRELSATEPGQAAELLAYAHEWAEENRWQLCGYRDHDAGRDAVYPPGPPPWKPKHNDDADNMLCGAIYAELYALDGSKNATWIADTSKTILAEVASLA
jgi:hypothetical protein